MKLKIKTNIAGISLIEVLVSTTIFVIILLSITSIFKMVVNSQREAIATQNVQENLKYFFEVISKEIRMAQRAGGGCPGLPANRRFFKQSNDYGDILYLRNHHDECVIYDLAEHNGVVRFRVSRDGTDDFLSPAAINISDLKFIIHEDSVSQAYVSINLMAHALGREKEVSKMHVQTTITSRYYRPMNP